MNPLGALKRMSFVDLECARRQQQAPACRSREPGNLQREIGVQRLSGFLPIAHALEFDGGPCGQPALDFVLHLLPSPRLIALAVLETTVERLLSGETHVDVALQIAIVVQFERAFALDRGLVALRRRTLVVSWCVL